MQTDMSITVYVFVIFIFQPRSPIEAAYSRSCCHFVGQRLPFRP